MNSLRHQFRQFKHRRRVAKALHSLEGPKPEAMPHGLDTPLVISLTSFPLRFDVLPRTLRCLLRQTVKPDHVVLWITHGDMPMVTDEIYALQEEGLTILPSEEMRAFGKLLPALDAYAGATIVTADDDVFYAANWLGGMVEGFRQTGAKVVCHRAHEVVFDAKDTLLPYTEWPSNIAGPRQSGRLFPTGVGGVLYRPDAFDSRVQDYELAKTLCPNSDDVWFYWMQRMVGTAAYKVAGQNRVLEWNPDMEVSLRASNLTGGNDKQIERMRNHFGFPPFD